MKKILVATAFGALLLSSSIGAFAADGKAYVGASAGLFMLEDSKLTNNGGTATGSFDTGYTVSGAVGYAFGNGLRLEGEISRRGADFDKIAERGFADVKVDSEVHATSFMANAFFDIKSQSIVTPYFGGGIGISNVGIGRGKVQGTTVWDSDDDTVFAYQVGAGVGFDLTKNVTLDLGYRYFATEKAKFEFTDAEVASHNVTVGVRYLF